MGLLSKNPGGDEQKNPGGFSLDLEVMVCPRCRREMPPWLKVCREDGTTLVRRQELADDGPTIPEHLLDDEDA